MVVFVMLQPLEHLPLPKVTGYITFFLNSEALANKKADPEGST